MLSCDCVWRRLRERVTDAPTMISRVRIPNMRDFHIYRLIDHKGGGHLMDTYLKLGIEGAMSYLRPYLPVYVYETESSEATVTWASWRRWRMAREYAQSREESAEIDLNCEAELPPCAADSWQGNQRYMVFEEHGACWKLEHRGLYGETLLHLLLEGSTCIHLEIAEALLRLYPRLSVDIYEHPELYGQSALHLAVLNGHYALTKLLVNSGARVDQRASGRFFRPDDCKLPKRTTPTDYKGCAYFGEYPFRWRVFAACRGDTQCYDLLLEAGANPDLQDSLGNTVLHMLVIIKPGRHCKRAADSNIENDAGLTPLTLAAHMGRESLFNAMLELNCEELWRYNNISCSVYPLHAIDSISPDGGTNWNSAIMIIVKGETREHLEMLTGGIIQKLLEEKWVTFGRATYTKKLCLHILHLSLLSIAVYLRPHRGVDAAAVTYATTWVRYVAEAGAVLSATAFLFLQNIWEIKVQGFSRFLKNLHYAPSKACFTLSSIVLLLAVVARFMLSPYIEDALTAVAIPGCWLYLLFFARSMRLTGPFVTMIYLMLRGDLFRFSIIYLILNMAFSPAFYLLFQSANIICANDATMNVTEWDTLSKTGAMLFQMMLNSFKYEEFSCTHKPVLTKFVFVSYMILVSILLVNMLIAMMGNTYQSINSVSEKEWRRQWAAVLLLLERSCDKTTSLRHMHDYSIVFPAGPQHPGGASVDARGLMVIKTVAKTRAMQRRYAVGNWTRVVNMIISTPARTPRTRRSPSPPPPPHQRQVRSVPRGREERTTKRSTLRAPSVGRKMFSCQAASVSKGSIRGGDEGAGTWKRGPEERFLVQPAPVVHRMSFGRCHGPRDISPLRRSLPHILQFVSLPGDITSNEFLSEQEKSDDVAESNVNEKKDPSHFFITTLDENDGKATPATQTFEMKSSRASQGDAQKNDACQRKKKNCLQFSRLSRHLQRSSKITCISSFTGNDCQLVLSGTECDN
ncbi:PREDICTED: transient receptor potential cation channel subfamily V member 6-like [Priapulus caudatus]|uniref:Transient receptor potential cation channel subfamily V member 6-like n=1 Tax=Priapulus caudatus TaxID=37621 RepID=A0ABM1EFW9_PRICU|nr:PREDICTED: transient receptor potential cation channel subfamily V member 6-like [Priapulus caudatus]